MSSASGPENGNRAEQIPSRRQNLWRADLVCPAGSPPIRGGAVLARGGRIEAVGPEAEVRPKGPLVPERNFGRAVLVPGLVNTHTHLELSGFEFSGFYILFDYCFRLFFRFLFRTNVDPNKVAPSGG